MAVYAPGDDPPAPNAIDPGMWARLMGYAGQLSPIGLAQAAEAPRGPVPRPFQGPGTAGQSGGWPVNAAGQPQYAMPPLKQAIASGPGNTNTPPILPYLGGPGGPNVQGQPMLPYTNPNTAALANAASILPTLPTLPTLPPTGGIGSDANFPVMGAGGFPTTYAPPGQQPSVPTPVPSGASKPVTPTPATAYPATIDPRMQGVVPPASAPSSMFTTVDAPNANPGIGGGMMGGALARGGPSGRGQITALDLSHLFGGGQPVAAPLPKKKINVGKIPDSARAEVPPDTVSKAPSDYGPLQRNRRWKMENPDLYR